MIGRIVRSWLLLTLAGVAGFVALYEVGILGSPLERWYLPSPGVWAVALGALAVSILSALDDEQPRGEEKIEQMTFAGLAFILLVKRKALLALVVLSVAGIGLGIYYVSKWAGVTLETEGGTLSMKFSGQTVYYFPISSQQSWQNTGIRLKANQVFKYSLTGYVSPGYLQDIDERNRQLREHRKSGKPYVQGDPEWPFTDPRGYDSLPNFYTDKANRDRMRCDAWFPRDRTAKANCRLAITKPFLVDTGLTVQGVAHNRVVGIILNSGQPKEAGVEKPGYVYRAQENQDRLILFDAAEPTRLNSETAKADGLLWVVINDADSYRWDNAGLFFLKLVVP